MLENEKNPVKFRDIIKWLLVGSGIFYWAAFIIKNVF